MSDEIGGIFTIDELSEYLKISKSTLYKLAQEGSIPCQKVGKHWRFHRDTIDEWLKSRTPHLGTVHPTLGRRGCSRSRPG